MKNKLLVPLATILIAASAALSRGATITVTTADNVNPGTGTSLLLALQAVQIGDTVAFNIPGAGPHVIATHLGGYPLITANNVTIDGYTQSGAVPNSNPILAANNAQIKIVSVTTLKPTLFTTIGRLISSPRPETKVFH